MLWGLLHLSRRQRRLYHHYHHRPNTPRQGPVDSRTLHAHRNSAAAREIHPVVCSVHLRVSTPHTMTPYYARSRCGNYSSPSGVGRDWPCCGSMTYCWRVCRCHGRRRRDGRRGRGLGKRRRCGRSGRKHWGLNGCGLGGNRGRGSRIVY